MVVKKILVFIILIIIFNFNSKSQISQGGLPPSFKYSVPEYYELKEYKAPDINNIIKEDEKYDKLGEIYRVGISVPINANIQNSGTWVDIPNKGKLWRFMIKVENALALGIYFDKFFLPRGGELYVYNYDKTQVIGAFTEINNHESGLFATELIYDDVVTIEYFEPYRTTNKAQINISEVAYVYRGVNRYKYKDFGDSESCEVNVNCSEGNNWQNQKKGVARIFLKFGSYYGWCSGSAINNVRQDCMPYLLTADHCGQGSSAADRNQWVFYFNYESSGCSNPSTEPSSNTITGCTLVANGGNGGSSGSDFYLVKLNNSIPTSYNVFFNGWDNQNIGATSGVGIHHPSGDIKKISTFTQPLVTTDWNGSGLASHWRVVWAATANGHGVTEGGSSGSPLFNSNGLIVGQLTGGSSYCSTPTSPDSYGKFSYSWDQNGTTSTMRLKDWLDPDNTGAVTLQGKMCPGNSSPALDANFIGNPTNITVGGSVNFTDLSTGNPTSWNWVFTGGMPSSSNAQNPTNIVYNTAGTYPVSLTISDGTNSDTETKSGYIIVSNSQTPSSNSCDTLAFPLQGNVVLYKTSAGGYAAGNNGYRDKAKAEYFSNYAPFAQINGGLFWFGRATGSGNVTFAIWDNSGVNSSPGNTPIATVSKSISSIIADVNNHQYTYVPFNPPITIPGPFYMGVI
ncbi:MAG TPA: PKD domain-containing protein, partial [Bacteroidales bacterium]|nr:PKD domain-containing protein [Bacteroidales bacterium]